MKMRNKGLLRAVSVWMAIALLLACLPCAALADSFSAAVRAKTMYVAADPFGTKVIGKLSKNTIVTVKEVNGGVARISYRGKTGYAKVSDMVTVESFAEKAIARVNTYIYEKPSTKSARTKISSGTGMYVLAIKGSVAMVERNGTVGYANLQHLLLESQASAGNGAQIPDDDMSALTQDSKKAVTTVNTYIFQKPDLTSAYVKVSAGTNMRLLAVKGNAAMVERNGVIGYTNRKHLIVEGESLPDSGESNQSQPGKGSSSLPSVSEAFKSGKYSNEQLCYLFLRQVMGYNDAAAAGVLSNIHYESSFRTAINGDGGTSYGLCQWHASRKTMLLQYCAAYNVSADSLVGQLAYLKYELENYYPLVHDYLNRVENSAQGAYDAGYYFCYYFENPASRESQSIKRGNTAMDTYYSRYASL